MPIVEMPDGTRVQFPDDMPKEQIRSMIAAKFPQVERQARAQEEAAKLAPLTSGGLQASSGGINSGIFGNFDDEIGAAMTAPFRMFKDQVGPVEAYKREQALNEAIKNQQRTANPVASGVGQVAGGLALAGKAGQAGLTTAGRIGTATGARAAEGAIEGAGYGALYAAGDPGEEGRLRAAGEGAAVGALTGGAVGGTLGKVANMRASAASKAAQKAAPSLDDLRATEAQLFNSARQSGVYVKPQGVDRLASNMQAAAGRINQNLRPKTAGVLDDIMAMKGMPADVQAIHEMRQGIQQAMSGADPQDVRTLSQMLAVLDNFLENPNPSMISGSPQGFATLREAIDTSSRRFKTEAIEKLMDFADVKTGQYTQSGMMNALRSEAAKLYRQIANGKAKGFTKEEIAIVRALAKTENSGTAMKLLARFAPRGPVSMIGSTMVGGMMGGPVGAAIPAAAGAMAARSADRAALASVNTLRNSAALGGLPPQILPQIGRGANVLIAPAAQQAQAIRP